MESVWAEGSCSCLWVFFLGFEAVLRSIYMSEGGGGNGMTVKNIYRKYLARLVDG